MADDTNDKLEEVELPEEEQTSDLHKVIFVQSMYREWFLDYACGVFSTRWTNWRTGVTTRWPTSWVTR